VFPNLQPINYALFTVDEALNCLHDLLCGLRSIHTADLIHSDICTNNVMVSELNIYQFIDFGFTQCLDENMHWGTPTFAAPEVFNNPTADITFATDIFSLGVVFGVLLSPTIHQLASFGFEEETEEYINIVNSIDRTSLSQTQQEALSILSQMIQVSPINRITTEDLFSMPQFQDIHRKRKLSSLQA